MKIIRNLCYQRSKYRTQMTLIGQIDADLSWALYGESNKIRENHKKSVLSAFQNIERG